MARTSEEHRARMAQYRKDHPEKAREACARWRAAHPERCKASSQRWRDANRERVQEYDRQRYLSQGYDADKASARWFAMTPEEREEHRRVRRVKYAALPRRPKA